MTNERSTTDGLDVKDHGRGALTITGEGISSDDRIIARRKSYDTARSIADPRRFRILSQTSF